MYELYITKDKEEAIAREIGKTFKEARQKKGASLREVGQKVEINYSYLGRIERGAIPSMAVILELCHFYELPIASLFAEHFEGNIKSEWNDFINKMEQKNVSVAEISHIIDSYHLIMKITEKTNTIKNSGELLYEE